MVVYDLLCANAHRFEGWFPSFEEFQKQAERSLVSCPTCASTEIQKLPHACAVHLRKEDSTPARSQPKTAASQPPSPVELKEVLLRLHHYVNQNFENVGPRFAEQARQIHSGEAESRPIHGTATPEEREALTEEGIPYLMLPKPDLDS